MLPIRSKILDNFGENFSKKIYISDPIRSENSDFHPWKLSIFNRVALAHRANCTNLRCAARICAEINLVAQICANLRNRLFRIYALSFARIISSHLRTIANNRYHAARIKANSINATQRVTRLKA